MSTKRYAKGDIVTGTDVYRFAGHTWFHVYEVLEVQDRPRFGRPDQLLTVKRSTNEGKVIESSEKRWATQLF
jgi:hypothetical protein